MARAGIAILAVVAAIVLFFVFRPSGDDAATTTATAAETETAPTTGPRTTAPATTRPQPPPRVIVSIDATRDAIARPKVDQGRQVVLRVTADVADHVHVHGYDLVADVAPGEPAQITFQATIPGVFEIELEDTGRHIAELEVRP